MKARRLPTLSALLALALALAAPVAEAGSVPVRTRNGMVVCQNAIAAQVGTEVLLAGGNAVDAAVATAFALAVVHPAAGNLGGGGFLLVRPAHAAAAVYDFREQAPAAATPTLFLQGGKYSPERHHDSPVSVGVPGTVAGLNMAWADNGRMPWKELLQPAQFSRQGVPYEMGDVLRQPDLARTLERIAEKGARGFYTGETAELIEREMKASGGLVTREDLRQYSVYRRPPLRGTYRGAEVLTVPPPSAGGVALLQCLNILEDYDVPGLGAGSSAFVHTVSEAMRRAFADRARFLGDPETVKDMPVERLVSKEYAAALRKSIRTDRASVSTPDSFEWPVESAETTHFSVVDADRNAVALTTTLEDSYGSKMVVPGAGFLLNNEMGDFNAGPGLTDASGLVGSDPNLAGPHKRMLSSMTPTIVVRDGGAYLVTGSPGGRTIPSTVLLTLLNVLDFGMNPQEAVDAPRFNHQWLPDEIQFERYGLSVDTLEALAKRGHKLVQIGGQGVAEVILVNAREGFLEGGCDRRAPDGAAVGR
jgi:gamma-glutamyltranspeptidase/glutathione hydrolase